MPAGGCALHAFSLSLRTSKRSSITEGRDSFYPVLPSVHRNGDGPIIPVRQVAAVPPRRSRGRTWDARFTSAQECGRSCPPTRAAYAQASVFVRKRVRAKRDVRHWPVLLLLSAGLLHRVPYMRQRLGTAPGRYLRAWLECDVAKRAPHRESAECTRFHLCNRLTLKALGPLGPG